MYFSSTIKFYVRVLVKSWRDKNFRTHAFEEGRFFLRQYLPARLVTPRQKYIFCRYLAVKKSLQPAGRWLPPLALKYRLSAYGLLFDEAGRVLLVSDRDLNFGWNFPGGGTNKGETLAEGLRREYEEETGLKVKVGRAIANRDDFCIMPTGRAVHAVLHFYLVEVEGGQLQPNGNGFDTTKVEFKDLTTLNPDTVNDYPVMIEIIKAGWQLLAL